MSHKPERKGGKGKIRETLIRLTSELQVEEGRLRDFKVCVHSPLWNHASGNLSCE